MRVCIVGIGHVGSTVAYTLLLEQSLRELVLVSRNIKRVEGEVLDLQHAAHFLDTATRVRAGGLSDGGCDLVILTLSAPQQSSLRSELAVANAATFREVVPPLAEANPDAVFLVVTNPVESLTQLTIELSGLPASRVLGTGTLIDSLRFRSTLSRHLGIHPDDVRAYVIGEHGELQFPLLSSASTGGVKLDPDDIPPSAMAAAKQAGHIVFESRGYTNFAISQAVVMIVRSIIDDQRRTMPVSTLIENVRGVPQVCLSVPCVVGREGIVRRLLPKLDLGEREQFAACALEVQRIFAAMHAG